MHKAGKSVGGKDGGDQVYWVVPIDPRPSSDTGQIFSYQTVEMLAFAPQPGQPSSIIAALGDARALDASKYQA